MEGPPLGRNTPGRQLLEFLSIQDSAPPLEAMPRVQQNLRRDWGSCRTSSAVDSTVTDWVSVQPRGFQEDPRTSFVLLLWFLDLGRAGL